MSLNLDQLKERNSQELSKLEKPYQLAVYAIPEEQWEVFTGLMKDNLTLLPTIASELRHSAAEKTLSENTRLIQLSLAELSKQDGKHHDESWKHLNDLEQNLMRRLDSLTKELPIMLLTGFLSLLILLGLLVIFVR